MRKEAAGAKPDCGHVRGVSALAREASAGRRPQPNWRLPLLQFCTAVRKIVCSRTSAYLTALCGVGVLLYLGSTWTALLTLLLSFTLWMAA